ncbi:MAG: dihydrolipoamide acetyltransferase family protein [Planctomycetota bacterium]
MTTLEFKLPDIGEGVREGEIVRWIVEEGGAVKEDDPVVEVMTDKATVEIPSPGNGVVSKHLFKEGEVANVGAVLFLVETEGGSKGRGGKKAAVSASQASAGDAGLKTASPSAVAVAPPASAGSGAKVLAAPATRRLARELGVDLGTVTGSGPHGRIRNADVRGAVEAASAASSPTASPAPVHALPSFPHVAGERAVERIPFRGIRKLTAEAMVRSKTTAAHFSLIEEVDVTELKNVRARAKEFGSRYGVKVTYLPYIMKAVSAALQEYPQLNAMLDEEKQELLIHKYVNLGIAVDTPRGLVVPVVEDVPLKGVLQLSAEVQDLAGRAREGKIKPEELKGSTFSITNAGNIGGVLATPILNFPNVGIVGVHTIRRLPRVMADDSIVPRDILWLSISIDHRLVDGADGARFMVRVRDLLEDPARLLL